MLIDVVCLRMQFVLLGIARLLRFGGEKSGWRRGCPSARRLSCEDPDTRGLGSLSERDLGRNIKIRRLLI